jgi:hypothetical protein
VHYIIKYFYAHLMIYGDVHYMHYLV